MNTNMELKIFSDGNSRAFATKICEHVNIKLGEIENVTFPSGECYSQFLENIRGCDTFLVVQPETGNVNASLMRLLIMADAARRASASRITAICPCSFYQRQERKTKSRTPISAKLVLDIIAAAGINRVVTMDLHAPQIAGFTNLGFDHLYFRPSLIAALKDKNINVVVSPDIGGVKRAEECARYLDVDLAIISKKRKNTLNVETTHFIGDVNNRNVLIVDDLTESAGTLIEAATQCRAHGAKQINCAITHGCFTNTGNYRLVEAFRDNVINHLFVSNTVETKVDNKWRGFTASHTPMDLDYNNRVTVVDVSSIFGKAIISIHNNESISSLFL